MDTEKLEFDLTLYPQPVLRKVADPIEDFGPELRATVEAMFECMTRSNGVGLAAPQVGVPLQLFVMDPGWKNGRQTPYVCANPFISALGEETRACQEMCLSIPDQPVTVTRPAHVQLCWRDAQDAPHEEELTGDAAVIAQHEADHLEGVLCIDHREDAA